MKNSVSGLMRRGIDPAALCSLSCSSFSKWLSIAWRIISRWCWSSALPRRRSLRDRVAVAELDVPERAVLRGVDVLDGPALVDVAVAAQLEQVVVLAQRDLVGFVPCFVALWIFAVAVTPPGVALILVTSTYASLRSVVLGDREDADPLDQPQVVRVDRGQPVDEVLEVPVRRRVAQPEERARATGSPPGGSASPCSAARP